MNKKKQRGTFSGSIGFVLAAAGSAVGLGNIWRFPYLAAKDGGGLFLVMYIILALTFGFTLLATEVAIGRRTKQGPLTAYKKVNKKWGGIGVFACLVPIIILPYYCVIGGWIVKYLIAFISGEGTSAAYDGYFTDYITSDIEPMIMLFIFLFLVAYIVFRGVNKGIESSSKIIMPILILLVIGISLFSLTITHTDGNTTRTGLQGLYVYIIPNIDGLTVKQFFTTLLDAMGQLFFSLSIAMGIMIAYGSYVRDDANLGKSINQIEIFDTLIAFLAGVMIIPAVYTFMGHDGLTSSGPSLMFISLPKVFAAMGSSGRFIGILFFAMVLFAAITSAVSVMEAVVSSFMDKFGWSRIKATAVETTAALLGGIAVCLGYNKWFFEFKLPNGTTAQLLDVLDYISNNLLMPVVSISTCLLIGWVVKPKYVIEEFERNGHKFGRRNMYIVMIKIIAPLLLFILLLKSSGLVTFI
jgi:NSS family neurotransmitter:Na+ symporter